MKPLPRRFLPTTPAILKAAIRTEKARRNLAEFVCQAWPIVEPAPLVWGWHMDAICQHLEAVTRGEITRLLITVPPRHTKSLLVSVLWPAWIWIARPDWRSLFISHSAVLAVEHSRACRLLVESDWYRERFSGPGGWTLAPDQNAKDNYRTTRHGHRFSVGMGGGITGHGGDLVAMDDLLAVGNALSPAHREEARFVVGKVLPTRLNDPVTGRMVMIMQRVHEDDPAGFWLAGGHCEHLSLPTEFEPESRCETHRMIDVPANGTPAHKARVFFWSDPRTETGELLYPSRFPAEEIAKLKASDSLGERDFAAQHQQRPSPMGGGMFQRAWWRFWKPDGTAPDQTAARPRGCFEGPARALPARLDQVIVSVDANFKAKAGADPVSIGVVGVKGAERFLLHRVAGPLGFTRTKDALREVRKLYPRARKWIVELAANGDAIVEDLIAEIPGMVGVTPRGGKEARAWTIQPQVQAGQCYLPDGAPWLAAWVDQFDAFPYGRHDDDVDMWSQALIDLSEPESMMDALVRLGGG